MKLVAASFIPAVTHATPHAPCHAGLVPEQNTPPRPHSRLWVADHLGLAADALAVATTQLGHVAPTVIGNFLEQSSRELCDLLPDTRDVFGPTSGIPADLARVNSAIQMLAQTYFLKNELPPAAVSSGWLLARYTYTVRRAQDLLEGIGA